MADRKLRQRTGCSLNFTELDFAIAMLIRATLFARGQLVKRFSAKSRCSLAGLSVFCAFLSIPPYSGGTKPRCFLAGSRWSWRENGFL